MTRIFASLAGMLVSALILVGCGTPERPTVSVVIGNQEVAASVNGYQWPNMGGGITVADAASVPAKGLKPYVAAPGAKARLQFSQDPNTIDLTTWHQGRLLSRHTLKSLEFPVPNHSGTYFYEVEAHYGRNYVDYDFAVRIE